MKSTLRFLLARLPWLPFLVTKILVKMFCLYPGFYRCARRRLDQKSCLAIEAGIQGWNSIEFKELYRSATEFLGMESVIKVVIDKSEPYVNQVGEVLRNPQLTHYLYDPRTGRQDLWNAFLESVQVAILMVRYRVVPIVYLTDLSFRVWRCQSAAVSAVSGVAVIFMMPSLVQGCFPHRRLVGPSLMPFSIETLEYLENLRRELLISDGIQPVVRFTGSLYEPRTTFLGQLWTELEKTDHQVEIMGREIGTARASDDTYWSRLSSAAIVITTADQMIQPGTDWIWVPNLVYRYLEVLASGSLLLAPSVPGISRYFEPGKHFVGFDSLEDAVLKSRYYLDHPEEAEFIRAAGQERAAQLIRTHAFWIQIDTALGYESLTS